jgi:methylthioribose-1-phosphate isomerase
VDAVIVGCDRVAANADVANKIGTLLKALAAGHAGVPFWVACPASTIDPAVPDGRGIPIEMRDPRELTHIRARTPAGELADVALMQEGLPALNPAFDVTPAQLVSALISEWGVVDASAAGVRAILDHARNGGTP